MFPENITFVGCRTRKILMQLCFHHLCLSSDIGITLFSRWQCWRWKEDEGKVLSSKERMMGQGHKDKVHAVPNARTEKFVIVEFVGSQAFVWFQNHS